MPAPILSILIMWICHIVSSAQWLVIRVRWGCHAQWWYAVGSWKRSLLRCLRKSTNQLQRRWLPLRRPRVRFPDPHLRLPPTHSEMKVVDHFSNAFDLRQCAVQEMLMSETGIDRHDHNLVHVRQDLFKHGRRS